MNKIHESNILYRVVIAFGGALPAVLLLQTGWILAELERPWGSLGLLAVAAGFVWWHDRGFRLGGGLVVVHGSDEQAERWNRWARRGMEADGGGALGAASNVGRRAP